jgi:addiction module RelE/StbE family toxin
MIRPVIYFADSFKKSYKKLVKRNPEIGFEILHCLLLFHQDPFTPSLRTHKLKGQLSDFYAFSVEAYLRIIFRFDNEDIIVVDIGSHNEVY